MHIIISHAKKPTTTAVFIADLPSNDSLRTQQVALNAAAAAASGFKTRTETTDGKNHFLVEIWTTKAAHDAYLTANASAISAYSTASATYNTAQGITGGSIVWTL